MKNSGSRQSHVALSALWIAAGMAAMACSKGDTVNTGNTNPTPVVSCGSLNAIEAANLFATRLDHLASVGLAALSGLENSRAVARLLTFGDTPVIDPFVSENQADIHDALVDLRDDQLIASNVESSTASSVTFLLNPETLCEGSAPPTAMPVVPTGGGTATGGSTASAIDPSCVAEHKAHPTRLRISRIDCTEGDNIAVEVLLDPAATRVLSAELYAERAEVELDLGALLKAAYDSSSGSSVPGVLVGAGGSPPTPTTRTESPIVSAATGVVHGSLVLSGTSQASGRISVTQAIDVTTAEEPPARIRFAAGTDVAVFSADGASKKIQVDANLGAFDANVAFRNFIDVFFGLSTTSAGATQPAVDLHASGVRGSLAFDGATDSIAAEGLQLVDGPATATQQGRALLSVNAAGSDAASLDVGLSGNADDSLNLLFGNGLAVDITYGLAPVMSVLENPANYLASDQLSVLAAGGTSMTLWKDLTSNDLAVVSIQTGELLRVNLGSFAMQSAEWPSDAVAVPSNQCLSRQENTQSGRHDLLEDFTVGACSR